MRKLLIFVIALLFVFLLASCSEFEHPITVNYLENETVKAAMIDYENDLILKLLNNAKWEDDTPSCGYDYELEFGNHNRVFYHSESGTFIDKEKGSFTVSNDDRIVINESLERNLKEYIHK